MEDSTAVVHRIIVLLTKVELLQRVYLQTGARRIESDWASLQSLLEGATCGKPLQIIRGKKRVITRI